VCKGKWRLQLALSRRKKYNGKPDKKNNGSKNNINHIDTFHFWAKRIFSN